MYDSSLRNCLEKYKSVPKAWKHIATNEPGQPKKSTKEKN